MISKTKRSEYDYEGPDDYDCQRPDNRDSQSDQRMPLEVEYADQIANHFNSRKRMVMNVLIGVIAVLGLVLGVVALLKASDQNGTSDSLSDSVCSSADIKFGRINCNSYGACDVECDHGYSVQGQLYCKDGDWITPLPACEKDCSATILETVRYMTTDSKTKCDTTASGHSCQFECEGVLQPKASIKCNNGVWETPQCVCPPLESQFYPGVAQTVFDTCVHKEVDDTCDVRCESGDLATDADELTCTVYGWQGEAFCACDKPLNIHGFASGCYGTEIGEICSDWTCTGSLTSEGHATCLLGGVWDTYDAQCACSTAELNKLLFHTGVRVQYCDVSIGERCNRFECIYEDLEVDLPAGPVLCDGYDGWVVDWPPSCVCPQADMVTDGFNAEPFECDLKLGDSCTTFTCDDPDQEVINNPRIDCTKEGWVSVVQPLCGEPSCIPVGRDCSANLECCSGTCDGSLCSCNSPNGACVFDADCCSNDEACWGSDGSTPFSGICAPSVCVPLNGFCNVEKKCCSGNCTSNACGCNPDNCVFDADCCDPGSECRGSNGITSESGTCEPSCIPVDRGCSNDLECCSGNCVNDLCECNQLNDDCVFDADCCSPNAACWGSDGSSAGSGICVTSVCVPLNGFCNVEKGCCSGNCTSNVCGCSSDNCVFDADCCGPDSECQGSNGITPESGTCVDRQFCDPLMVTNATFSGLNATLAPWCTNYTVGEVCPFKEYCVDEYEPLDPIVCSEEGWCFISDLDPVNSTTVYCEST